MVGRAPCRGPPFGAAHGDGASSSHPRAAWPMPMSKGVVAGAGRGRGPDGLQGAAVAEQGEGALAGVEAPRLVVRRPPRAWP